ncbi:hypothetical protein JYU34_015762 [Plutella xylostella]|uniref:FP protein C-terminal domain-containing protein n=2 Tax=Plutella xylostella TaxID=51655 RepID=A0ABQ7Q3R5_PLUXY|nr:hypothetical protein JYU34_016896 [Plutella xylostella]KAG7300207.1 hypothetical protein JYU34_015762 [Plutella xylostella]
MLRSPTTTLSPKSAIPSRSESDIPRMVQNEGHTAAAVTQRAKRRRDSGDYSNLADFNSLKEELKYMIGQLMSTQSERLDKLENHILDIKDHTTKIEHTNGEIEKSMTFMSDQMSSIEAQIKKLELEKGEMALQILNLEDKLDFYDHQLNKTSIEIRNVPKIMNESKEKLYDTIHYLSKQLCTDLHYQEIRDVSRAPSKKENRTSTIRVEFSNTLSKARFLSASKMYNKNNPNNKINSNLLGYPEPKIPVYVAEQLTAKAKRLFYLARIFVKTHNYNSCWTTNGRIFIKEKVDGAYIIVKNEQQLETLSKPNTV